MYTVFLKNPMDFREWHCLKFEIAKNSHEDLVKSALKLGVQKGFWASLYVQVDNFQKVHFVHHIRTFYMTGLLCRKTCQNFPWNYEQNVPSENY